MNLQECLNNSNFIVEVPYNTMKNMKEIFNKSHGLKGYLNPYAAYMIDYTKKKVLLFCIFEEDYAEIKAFKQICEKYGFTHKIETIYNELSKKDKIIQTIKMIVTMQEVTKDKSKTYHETINTNEVIEKSKIMYENYLSIQKR